MEEKLNIIDGEFDNWISVNKFDLNADIADRVKIIYCDTRDFAIGWNFSSPKAFKKVEYGYEYRWNQGLRKLYKVFKKGENENKGKYIINKKDILKWLDNLCQETGGYNKDWRFLQADLEDCRNWDIKYIRFVRDIKNPDEFVVCNNYLFPIEYKGIISKLDKAYLFE